MGVAPFDGRGGAQGCHGDDVGTITVATLPAPRNSGTKRSATARVSVPASPGAVATAARLGPPLVIKLRAGGAGLHLRFVS